MELIKVGKIVNTHGIKGEIRIISDFKYKKDVFKVGNILYVDDDKLEINSYRVHKNFDMVTFKGINDINDVLKYKGSNAYINREEYKFDGYLYEDIIGLDVIIDNEKYGVVDTFLFSTAHPIIVIKDKDNNKHFVPYIDEYVKEINLEKHEILIEVIDGLL